MQYICRIRNVEVNIDVHENVLDFQMDNNLSKLFVSVLQM